VSNRDHVVSRWRVEGTCGEVADIIGDPAGLARWWPSVYLDVEEVEPPGPSGTGRRVRVLTKGWLPYTLAWEIAVVESRYPFGLTIDASGDLVGRGVWTFEQDGPHVNVGFEWQVRAATPLVTFLAPVVGRAFAANYRWAMAQGEASLRLELARRRATSEAARAAVPPPPGPVTYAAVALLGGAAIVAGTLAYLLRRARRTKR
jgi:hypothetical protein